jgi:hypothetical protein
MVANTGTGAFAKALLAEDFIMNPFPSLASGPMVAMFFGTHTRVNGTGLLALQNLPPALSVSTTQSSNTVAAGSLATLSANVTGGYAPYTYQWYQDSAAIVGQIVSQINVEWTMASTHTYFCSIIDAAGASTNTSILTLTFTATPNPIPTPTATSAPVAPTNHINPTSTPTTVPTNSPNPTDNSTSTTAPITPAPIISDSSMTTTYIAIGIIAGIALLSVLALTISKRSKK